MSLERDISEAVKKDVALAMGPDPELDEASVIADDPMLAKIVADKEAEYKRLNETKEAQFDNSPIKPLAFGDVVSRMPGGSDGFQKLPDSHKKAVLEGFVDYQKRESDRLTPEFLKEDPTFKPISETEWDESKNAVASQYKINLDDKKEDNPLYQAMLGAGEGLRPITDLFMKDKNTDIYDAEVNKPVGLSGQIGRGVGNLVGAAAIPVATAAAIGGSIPAFATATIAAATMAVPRLIQQLNNGVNPLQAITEASVDTATAAIPGGPIKQGAIAAGSAALTGLVGEAVSGKKDENFIRNVLTRAGLSAGAAFGLSKAVSGKILNKSTADIPQYDIEASLPKGAPAGEEGLDALYPKQLEPIEQVLEKVADVIEPEKLQRTAPYQPSASLKLAKSPPEVAKVVEEIDKAISSGKKLQISYKDKTGQVSSAGDKLLVRPEADKLISPIGYSQNRNAVYVHAYNNNGKLRSYIVYDKHGHGIQKASVHETEAIAGPLHPVGVEAKITTNFKNLTEKTFEVMDPEDVIKFARNELDEKDLLAAIELAGHKASDLNYNYIKDFALHRDELNQFLKESYGLDLLDDPADLLKAYEKLPRGIQDLVAAVDCN